MKMLPTCKTDQIIHENDFVFRIMNYYRMLLGAGLELPILL